MTSTPWILQLFLKKYLCIYLIAFGLSYSKWHLSLQLFVAVQASLVVAGRLLSSCGSRPLEYTGPAVAARRLSCPEVCGILVPQPAIEPTYPAVEGRVSTTGPPGKYPSPSSSLKLTEAKEIRYPLTRGTRCSLSLLFS